MGVGAAKRRSSLLDYELASFGEESSSTSFRDGNDIRKLPAGAGRGGWHRENRASSVFRVRRATSRVRSQSHARGAARVLLGRRVESRVFRGAMFKSLSAVQKALGALPAAMEPSRVNGKWHAPKFSRRKLAELRKAALGFDLPWDWDRERKPVREREPKGTSTTGSGRCARRRSRRRSRAAQLVAAYRAKRKIVPTTLNDHHVVAEITLKRRAAVNPQGKK